MIIPSHIPNVPRWITYSKANVIAYLDPLTDRYFYHSIANMRVDWAASADILYHMEQSTDIFPLTSLGYIISRISEGFEFPSFTIQLYFSDLLETINKEKLKD